MREYLLAGIVGCVAASAAHAADVARVAAAPALPALSFSGVYAGLNLGYGWGTATYTFDVNGAHFTDDIPGWLGGAQIGLDHVNGQFLFGIGGTIEGGQVFGRTGCPAVNTPPTLDGSATCQSAFDFITTVTGRAGVVLAASSLLYGKGGFAAGDYHYRTEATAPPHLGINQQNLWATGWTVGAGLEHTIAQHVTVFGEYDYYSLSTGTGTPNAASNGALAHNDAGHAWAHVSAVLIGLNIR
jgi:outer membrane immunogenic protein